MLRVRSRAVVLGILLAAILTLLPKYAVSEDKHDDVIQGTVYDATVTYQPGVLENVVGAMGMTEQEMNSFYQGLLRKFMQESGRALKDVIVTLESARPGVSMTTLSDARGRYEFAGLPPGWYTVRAQSPEGAVRMKRDAYEQCKRVEVGPGKESGDVALTFRFDGIVISGRVVDSSDNGLPGAAISIDPAEVPAGDSGGIAGTGLHWNQSLETVKTVTDHNGRFRVDDLCPASFWDAAQYLGGQLPVSTYVIKAELEGYAGCRMTLPVVTPELVGITRAAHTQFARISSELGIDDAPPRLQEVVQTAEFDGEVFSVGDLLLEKEAVLSGIVLDTRDRPMHEWYFSLNAVNIVESKPFTVETIVPGMTRTDTNGRFQFKAVPPGTYSFSIHDPWGKINQRSRNPEFEVASGQSLSNLKVVVESELDRGRLVGRVLNSATGAAVSGYEMRVRNVESLTEPNPEDGEVTVAADGRFELANVSPGTVTLQLTAPGYPATLLTENVASGQTREADLQMPPEAVVEGMVTLNGTPSGGSVHLYHTDGRPVLLPDGREDILKSADIDEAGRFRAAGLCAGEYLIHVNAVTGQADTTYFRHANRTVTLTAGEMQSLTISMTGSASIHGTFTFPDYYARGRVHLFPGRITSVEEGLPLHDYVQRLVASTERMRQRGVYEFKGLEPGEYTLMGFCYNNEKLEGEAREKDRPRVFHTLKVTEGEDQSFDFALP
ncbi:MAG: hypothetical protein AMXMBFR84_45230 [Candidatus Hydrogenedentota bacterium]